jgi:hypothetical protein
VRTHVGRSAVGHELEDSCHCRQAACGLIDARDRDPECPVHGIFPNKTMRQIHLSADCPATKEEERDAS